MEGILTFKIGTGSRTREQICERIAEIDGILDVLFTTALTSVANAGIMEYDVDTGSGLNQRVKYSTASQVTTAIKEYEKIRQMYQNKLMPRMTRLSDSKNFLR